MAMLAIYVGAVFAVGAATAYPLSLILDLVGFHEVPFHKLVTRNLQLLALLGLVPLLALLGINDRRHWGYGVPRRRFLRELLRGVAIGIGMLLVLVAVLFFLEVRVLDERVQWTLAGTVALLAKVLAAALLIGFIEESWYRGALFSALRQSGNLMTAMVATSVVYGLVHFIRADHAIASESLGWMSGFSVLAGSFGRFATAAIIDSLLALTAAGLFLALLRHGTGSIAQCIGVHAGWVVVIKLSKEASTVNHDSPWVFMVGSYDGVIGYAGLLWLSGLCIAYYLICLRPQLSKDSSSQ